MNDLQLYNPTKGAMIGVERKEHLGQTPFMYTIGEKLEESIELIQSTE